MHEYSLVQAMFEQIGAAAAARQAVAVRRVTVRVGEAAGVDLSLLQTAYQTFRERTICSDAPLVIREVPVEWACPEGHGPIARGRPLSCDTCGRPARLTSGDEIVLEQLELEVP
jgi:hydrogenase nickel incorporation protein HypA/HybF